MMLMMRFCSFGKIAQKKGCNIVVCIDEFQQIAELGILKRSKSDCVPYGNYKSRCPIVCSAVRSI